MPQFELPEEIYNGIVHLSRSYHREAERCRVGKAFLAGCVMAGAALEAMLLAVANCFPEEASCSEAAPRRNGKVRPLANWSFADLVAVARERGWLPYGLSRDEDWDDAKAGIGDYAEVLRQVRNLVHPIRYAHDMPRKRITSRYLQISFEILEVASGYLRNKVLASLKELIDKEDGSA